MTYKSYRKKQTNTWLLLINQSLLSLLELWFKENEWH
jgi:hypothetical protein